MPTEKVSIIGDFLAAHRSVVRALAPDRHRRVFHRLGLHRVLPVRRVGVAAVDGGQGRAWRGLKLHNKGRKLYNKNERANYQLTDL